MIPEYLPSLIILGCALFPPSKFWVRVLLIFFAVCIEAAIFKYNFRGDPQAYIDSAPNYNRDR